MKKSTIKIISFIFIIIFCLQYIPIVKGETLKYAVISPKVNVRNAPNLTADVVYLIDKNGEFLITQEFKDSEAKLWYKIKINDKIQGFIASWVVDKIITKITEVPVSNKIVIIEANVRIRLSPDLSSEIKLIVQEKIEKQIISEISDTDNRTWYKIKLNDGTYGWVASWIVTVKSLTTEKKSASNKLIIIDAGVNLRKGPSLTFEIISLIQSHLETKGIYEVLDNNGKVWYSIKLPNGVEGWVASWIVTVKEFSSQETKVDNKIAIIEPVVNIRDIPSVNGKVVTVINKRGEFNIINQNTDVNGKLWYQIQLDNGKGWVASWVITIKNTPSAGNVTKSSVNVRNGPGSTYEKIYEIPSNTKVTILGSAYTLNNEYWIAVEYKSVNGWALSSLISLDQKFELIDIAKIGFTFKTPENIKIDLKSGPGDTYSAKTQQLTSTSGEVKVVGIAKNHKNEIWYQVAGSEIENSWTNSNNINDFIKSNPTKYFKLTGFSYELKSNGFTFILSFDEDGTYKYDTFLLSDPLRFVIDIKDSTLFQKEYLEEINKSQISRVRANQFSINPNIVRIVLDMSKNLKYTISKGKKSLIINLTDYSSYSGPRLFINGLELENNLLLKEINKKIFVPLYIFSNMSGGILSWDEKSNEAILKLNDNEYRFKQNTKYVFIKNAEHQIRLDISDEISIANDILYLSIEDIEKIFQIAYTNYDNFHYLDNAISSINVSNISNSFIYTINTVFPIKYNVENSNKMLNILFDNTILPNSIKIPNNHELLKATSNKRGNTSSSSTQLQFDISILPKYETALLMDDHQFVLTLKTSSSKGVSGKLIILDAGHGSFEDGYYDVGAIGPTGILESFVNLQVVLKLRDFLEKEGAKVLLTRDKEQDKNTLSLEQRVDMANKSGADLYICIHQNAFMDQKANGSEVYYFYDNAEELSEIVLDSLSSKTGLLARDTKKKGFAVTKDITTMPSILIECAFLSNPEEEKMLQSDNFLSLIAEGILTGIKKYFENQ